MSWFATGDDQVDGGDASSKKWVPYYGHKVGTENQITFLDGPSDVHTFVDPETKRKVKVGMPFKIKRHQLTLVRKGKKTFYNYFTCLTPMHKADPRNPKCPICMEGDEPRQVALFTIVDHAKYKDKNGKIRKDEIKILAVPTKSAIYEMLLKEDTRRKGLRGCTYEITRVNKQSPAIGEMYSFVCKEDITNKDWVARNYLEDVAPMSVEDIEMAITRIAQDDDDDDDAPRKSRNTRTRRPTDDDDDDDAPRTSRRASRDDDDDDEDEKPRSRRASREEDEDDDEAPRTRRAGVTKVDDDDDDDSIDDAIPF